MKKLRMQSWAIPRYSFHVRIMFELISRKLVHLLWKLIVTFFILQYGLNQQKEAINDLIEKAIYEANKKGAKVVSLGLLNQVRHFFHCSKHRGWKLERDLM
jgi:aldehyde decarbonylase